MKLALGIFLALLVAGEVQAAEVFKMNDDMYIQDFQGNRIKMAYLVDTVTHQCFVLSSIKLESNTLTSSPAPIAIIPCVDLARRPEWKSILTWVK